MLLQMHQSRLNIAVAGQGIEQDTVGCALLVKVLQVKQIGALVAAPPSAGNQLTQLLVTALVFGQQDQVMALDIKLRADDQFNLERILLHAAPGAHDAGQRTFVGNCQGAIAQFGGSADQLLWVRRGT